MPEGQGSDPKEEPMEAQPTSVLVVGGSLVGLSAAVFLAWRGGPTVLVERHPGSSPHPRAIGYTPRTMELFCAVGLGRRIPQVPPGTRRRPRRVRVGSASRASPGSGSRRPPGRPRSRRSSRSSTRRAGAPRSPRTGSSRYFAKGRSSSAPTSGSRPSWSASSRTQMASRRGCAGATGTNTPCAPPTWSRRTATAARCARRWGSAAPGGHLRTGRSVLFCTPLEEYLRTGIRQFSIDQPGFDAFLTTYSDGR